jgi:MFS family permease
MAISVFIFAPVAGILATRFGPKWIVTTGMTLEAIALFSMSQIISVANPVYYLYPILVIYGAGVGLAISQLTSTVLLSIPWQKAGVGSGANNTVRQIGSAFGIAVIGAVLVAQISAVGQADLAASAINFGPLRSALATALNSGLSGGIDPSFIASFGRNAPAVLSILYDAITQGTRWAAFTAGIFVSLGAISSLLIPNPKSAQTAKATVVPKTGIRETSRAVSAIVIAQFAITIGLLAAISNEYQSNYFMQQWISQNASPLGYFLAGYVGTALATIVGAGLILWKLVLTRRQSEAKSKPKI